MADPVTDPVAEHDARYGEEGAGPPEWARVRDRLARAGVAWFTTTRRAWTHGHGTRSTEKDGLDLVAGRHNLGVFLTEADAEEAKRLVESHVAKCFIEPLPMVL